jgi:hypothetical protein
VLHVSCGYAALGGSLALAHENPNDPGTQPATVESGPHDDDVCTSVKQQYVVEPAFPGWP